MFALKVVVRTDLLHQLVIDAEEGDEDADDFEGFGAEPGRVRLGVLGEAGLRRVVQAGFGLLGAVRLLVLHATVEGFDVFGVDGGLLRRVELDLRVKRVLLLENLELHHLGRRNDADRHVPETGGVVAEVDGERPVDVVHDLAGHQQAELERLDVEVEVAPAEDLFSLHGGFEGRFALGSVACLVQELRLVSDPFVWVLEAEGGRFGFDGRVVHCGEYPGGLVRRFDTSCSVWEALEDCAGRSLLQVIQRFAHLFLQAVYLRTHTHTHTWRR